MRPYLLLPAVVLVSLAATASDVSIRSNSNSCLRFDGVDDFVHVARTTALEPAEVTVELWARLDGPQDWNSRLLRKGEHDAYFITADQDFDQRMQLLMTRGTQYRVQAKDTVPHTAYIGTWHHFLGVYADDHVEFWVDGVQKASVTHDLGALTHLPLTDLYIGAGLPVTLQNEYFAGAIDEVRIWNYPRTPPEIAASWDRSLAGYEPGLVAYWRFDEGEGQVAHDSSPCGHHGQLGSSPNVESTDPAWETSGVPLVTTKCSFTLQCAGGINSTGLAASIGYQGSASIAGNDLVLRVTHCVPDSFGFFFIGSHLRLVPWGKPGSCAMGDMHVLSGVVNLDAVGSGSYPIDFTDPASPASKIDPGAQQSFMFWYRDPGPGYHATNVSDVMRASFCP